MLRRSLRFAPIVATLALSIAPAVAGRVRSLRFIAIMSTALTMGMSFAHTLEFPGKMKYEGKLWWHLSRTLYRPWWGRAGYVEGLALCSVPGLAYHQAGTTTSGSGEQTGATTSSDDESEGSSLEPCIYGGGGMCTPEQNEAESEAERICGPGGPGAEARPDLCGG